jgi:hypothetical protein
MEWVHQQMTRSTYIAGTRYRCERAQDVFAMR